MPEYVRALVAAGVLAAAVLVLMKAAVAPLMPSGAYVQRRNAFLALLACGFLSPSFWIFGFMATIIVVYAARRQPDWPRAPLCLGLLFVVPPADVAVPGFGLANFLISMDFPRLLSLILLLPGLLLLLRANPSRRPRAFDRLFIAYFILQAVLALARGDSVTNGVRSALYVFIDAFLPYYVLSRSITRPEHLQDALAAFFTGALVIAAIATLESGRNWLVFKSMTEHWGVKFGMGNYLARGGHVRAAASTGQPIVLGFVMAVAIPCFLGLRAEMQGRLRKAAAMGILLLGALASVSRGPWMGALAGAFAYWMAASPSRLRIGVASAGTFGLLAATGCMPSLLPDIKGMAASSVDYRAMLLTNSVKVFWRTPWFGSTDYVDQLARRGLVQGEGIVDIVNTYIQIALASGAVGLTLFCTAFATLLHAIWNPGRRAPAIAAVPNAGDTGPASTMPRPARCAGLPAVSSRRVLVGALTAILVTIATVSSISVIPWVYWSFAGIAAAFVRMDGDKGLDGDGPGT
jgi:hypothetical protein